MPTAKRTLLDRIKSIKMPAFQLVLYSSLGYLGYIFYQDYRYKQLVQEINARSNKESVVSPLKKVTQIVNKISTTEGKRQLKFLLKDLQIVVENYWIDPRKIQNLIDFEMKEIQKSEDDKKIWWMTPYSTYSKLLLSIYHRSQVLKQGIFGLFFWSNYKVEQKNEVLEVRSINSMITKAIKLRRTKCQEFTIKQTAGGFQNEDRQIYECLSETSKQVSSLEKMVSRLQMIHENQAFR